MNNMIVSPSQDDYTDDPAGEWNADLDHMFDVLDPLQEVDLPMFMDMSYENDGEYLDQVDMGDVMVDDISM